jgi:hypothetical protein
MSDRYGTDTNSIVDETILTDGEQQFIGLDNRRTPDALEPGLVQVSQNMRFNQAVAQVRKGMSKQTNSIAVNLPLYCSDTVICGNSTITTNYTGVDGIFGAVLFSDPNNGNLEWVMVVTQAVAYLFTPGQSIVTIAYPANELIDITDTVDLFQAGGNIYLLRGLTDVSEAVASITHVTTTATVTTTPAHGYSTNQWVRISGATPSQYNGDFQITSTGANTFTYVMDSDPGANATGTLVLNRIKVPLKWDGNQAHTFTVMSHGTISGSRIYMPPSNFGLLQVNRAFLQYNRTQTIISDVDNVESYDSLYGVLNFADGWSDYLIGLHPYQDNKTLMFLRRSIYLLNNVDGDVAAITNQLLTAQIGCISRRSIKTCGANVLFLSDMGVFMLQPGLELQLRGNWEPLSSPISTTIQTINFNAIQSAVGAYWNNRYYLAIPTNGATRNNAMIVYNFLNAKWESVDTFPGAFMCDHMVVMNLSNFATLFLISKEGGIYAAEQNEQDDYGPASAAPAQYLIPGIIRTRRYTFGDLNLKYYNRAIANYTLNANCAFSATAYLINPNSTKILPSVSTTAATSIMRPMMVKKRGYGLELQLANTATRGNITNVTVSGYVCDRKNTSSQ